MNAKTPVLLVLTLIFAVILCGAASAGTPLNTTHNGTVSGDLYVNATQPVPFANQPTDATSREFTQTYNLPNNTGLDWARVYVNIYSGSGSANWPANVTVKLDGNGDGTYETTLGNELLTSENYSIDGTIYWINDHCFRVYSDYQAWYDVTGLITSNNPSIYVKTEQIGTQTFDGRLKMIALVAAYNDGDDDKVHYWVNDGQDWINTGSSQTTFKTSTFTRAVSNAALYNVALSSKDGSYNFNGQAFSGTDPVAPVNYFVTHRWNVTSNITPGQDSTLTYTLGAGSYKSVLATLTVKESDITPPTVNFTADKTSGAAPLTVHFTEQSTGATSWAWDFNNDGINDSTLQNPTYTFNNGGTYTVKLTVAGTGGIATETKNNYIIAIPNNYVSYFGSSSDELAQAIALDNDENIYITGYTTSGDFPTTNGAYQTSNAGGSDALLSKFNSAGTLVYSTYLGGSGSDYGLGIIVDAVGNVYVTGRTNSANFPTTTGAYQSTNGGGYDAFLSKFNSNGELVYSTYLGGTGTDYGNGVALDNNENIYIAGYSGSTNFPTTSDAYQANKSTSNDAFMSKFNSSGELVYSSFLGGTGQDYGYAITIDKNDNIYITGRTASSDFPITSGAYQTSIAGGADVFVTKFNSAGSLAYSTYLGGNDTDNGNSVAVDSNGNAYIGGQTKSKNLPVTVGAYQTSNAGVDYDGFVAKLNTNGTSLVYSTYLGGSASNSIETITGIAVDEEGNAHVIGYTNSGDFPVTPGAYQTVNKAGFYGDVFLTKLKSDGTGLLYSTFLGGSGNDRGNAITIDSAGNAYLTGNTNSGDFSVTPGAYQSTITNSYQEIFVAKLDLTSPVADFTADVLSDYAPSTVHFTDQTNSTTNLIAWAWDFNNDGIVDSNEQNPTYTYTTAGVYTVKLTVANVGDSSSTTKTDYITVLTPPDDTEAPTVTAIPVGGNFTSALQVFLSATDNYDINPKIYYTLDGTDPTTNSTLYTNPLIFTETTVLKFISADKFGNIGTIQTETYNINDTEAPVVTATPAEGTYHETTQINLSVTDNTDPNPIIYYTLDGTDPTTNSTIYTDPINLPNYVTTTLKYIAVDKSGNILPIQTLYYTITDIELPTVTYTKTGTTTITLNATDDMDLDPKIYYTLDGSDPTTNSTLYTGPFNLPRPAVTVLKFIAVDASGNTSPVQSETISTYLETDLLTTYYAQGHVNVIVDNGGTGYGGGNPTYNLNIPDGATILAAHLCLAWTWYGYSPYNVTFNGYNLTNLLAHYPDYNGYYGRNDGEGQDIYDVTQYFNANGTNTATITGGPQAQYGRVLIVVYEHASEPYRKIWINEGFDLLYYGPTTGFAFFDNVTTDKVDSTQLTIMLPSGDNDSPGVLFNGQTLNLNGTGGSDPSYKYYSVTSLQNGLNQLDVIGGGAYFSLQNAILTVTMEPVVANFTADTTVGDGPLTVQFTDNSTGTTGWAWDFNNDGTIDSTLQNPIWTFTNPGYYTVKLTATGPGGEDEEIKTDYIFVNGPDLVVTGITPNSGAGNTLFSNGNNTISVTVENQGTSPAPASTLKVTIDGEEYTVNVPALGVGESTTVTVTDTTSRSVGDSVPVNTDTDPNNSIPETNDSNNTLTTTLPVYNNGYRGKRYTNGNDINTTTVWSGNYNVIYSNGSAAYRSGSGSNWDTPYTATWTNTDLPIPADTNVVLARLYQPYTWNTALGVPDWTAQFNGKTLYDLTYYTDTKSYGTSNYPSGLLVYDVTSLFQTNGNTLTLTKGAATTASLYGSYLVVIYEDPNTAFKRIYINDGADMLCSNPTYSTNDEQATAYANYNLNTNKMSNAQLVAILASAGDENKSKFFFNGQEYTGFWNSYNRTTQTGFSLYDINSAVLNGFNTAALQSYNNGTNGDNMVALGTILVLTTDNQCPTVNCNLQGGLSRTTQTVTLTATDDQCTTPRIYYTLNGEEPTTNCTLYTGPISINETTTLKFIAVDDTGNISPEQTEIYTIDTIAPTATVFDPVNGQTNIAADKTIKVTFSEDIKKGHMWIELLNSELTAIPFTTTINGKVLTVAPTSNLAESLYTLWIHTGSVTDLAGNPVAVKSTKFSVGTSPTVSSVDPTNNKVINVANKALLITFSENIKAGSAFTNIKVTNPDGVKVNPLYKAINGKTLTLTRNGNYINGLTYTITLPTGSITDTAGNNINTYTSKFKIDTTKPKITSVNPTNNMVINVANRSLVITFSENIKAGSAFTSIKVTNPDGVKVKPLYKVINGKTLTLTRNGNYINGLTYTITLPTGSITDTAGNNINTYTSKFTVDFAKPTITRVNPRNNSSGFSLTAPITITFNENILEGVNWSKITMKNLNTGKTVSFTKTKNGKTLTIKMTYTRLHKNTYQIYIPAETVKDNAGNKQNTPYTLTFKTR
jgi:PKD repeat protein/methionine-rich copper-binding protein CopC